MNIPETQVIIDEIATLATAEGWDTVARACATASQPSIAEVLVVLGSGVKATELVAWIDQHTGTGVDVTPLEAAFAEPCSVLVHRKVLFAVSTEAIPSAADLAGHARLAAIVPPGCLATVMLLRGDISREADRDAVSRLAWALFVPEPKPVWSGQPLATQGVFLWAASEQMQKQDRNPNPNLESLMEWLAAPLTAAADRAHALDLAESLVGLAAQAAYLALQAQPSQSPTQKASTDRWRAGDAEFRLTARLRATIGEAETFRRQRLAETRAALEGIRLGGMGSHGDRSTGSQAGAFARLSIEVELSRLRADLDTHARDLQHDWARFVAESLAGAGLKEGHTAARDDLTLNVVPDRSLFCFDAPGNTAPIEAFPSGSLVIVGGGAVAGLAVGSLAGPVGVGVGLAAGVAGGIVVDQQRRQQESRRADLALDHWIERWRVRTESILIQQLLSLESVLSKRIRGVIRALQPNVPVPQQTAEMEATSKIRAWRERLHALVG